MSRRKSNKMKTIAPKEYHCLKELELDTKNVTYKMGVKSDMVFYDIGKR
jgi:hypothetical protein